MLITGITDTEVYAAVCIACDYVCRYAKKFYGRCFKTDRRQQKTEWREMN